MRLAHSGPDDGKAKRHHALPPHPGFDPPQKRVKPPKCRLLKPNEMANMPEAGTQPELQPEEKIMAWKTPKIVEVSLASEINCYACAEIG
jgi:coenzyme PQQ precursor peptide PqqA